MSRSVLTLSTVAPATLAVAACTNDGPRDSPGLDSAPNASSDVQPPPGADGNAAPEESLAEFQLDIIRAEAENLLGMNENELEPSRMLRITRRGDERFPGTMDLVPGRMNVELDNHAGAYLVTRVVVETPDGSVTVE